MSDKKACYITIVIKELIDVNEKHIMTNEALKRAEELKNMVPNSTITDVEIAEGLITTEIK